MFGELDKPENARLSDCNGREVAYMVPIVILMIWIGVYPKPYLRSMEASVSYWLNHVQQASVQRERQRRKPRCRRWYNDRRIPVADGSGKED